MAAPPDSAYVSPLLHNHYTAKSPNKSLSPSLAHQNFSPKTFLLPPQSFPQNYEEFIATGSKPSSIVHNDFINLNKVDNYGTNRNKRNNRNSRNSRNANDNKKKFFHYETEMNTFPESFKPRQASNMPHKEKVSKWILDVPIFPLGDTIWSNDCYPALIDDSSFSISDDNNFVDDFPFNPSADDMLELQARRITYYTNKLYLMDPHEEIINGNELLAFIKSQNQKNTNDKIEVESEVECGHIKTNSPIATAFTSPQ
ncbi:uncharacterized protein ASCRUDRAFT_76999 [Ascoidea rubescens DSM 1968]|uniref:Uncharacterized protein n=1 Tax=Ascoidea rubescens DSM 1968 TaxID=1344418 RepID=A0A1D2VDR0_9ASCO|nr:hypothetical protein ASCRUDRAFT_76999 [Ascoidea rubescens DSM 1968]ODV59650.1 hypothetical protein ASCRUDRAFT_76999 [Ascoidea rubescens DSM 1968]